MSTFDHPQLIKDINTSLSPFRRSQADAMGHFTQLAQAAMAEGGEGARSKLARFYIGRLLPEHAAFLEHARAGADDLYAFTLEDFAA